MEFLVILIQVFEKKNITFILLNQQYPNHNPIICCATFVTLKGNNGKKEGKVHPLCNIKILSLHLQVLHIGIFLTGDFHSNRKRLRESDNRPQRRRRHTRKSHGSTRRDT